MPPDLTVATTSPPLPPERPSWRAVFRRLRLVGVAIVFLMSAVAALAPEQSLGALQHLASGHAGESMRSIGSPGRVAVAAPLAASFDRPLLFPPVLSSPSIVLTAMESDLSLLPGSLTRMWTYNGIFPGPTIRRPTGQTTQVTLNNGLQPGAGSLSLHHHGNHSSAENDGQPSSFLVSSGSSRTYTYTGMERGVPERGAFQWYHDHRDMVTGRNVWMGLAGMFILDDPADPQTLPAGEFDVPLMIADRAFDGNNQLVYSFSPFGVAGEFILVNGVVQPYFDVGDRRYRLRILNASNLREYALELSNGQPMLQIGTDSGLLPGPVARTNILIGPGERVDLVIDFGGLLGQNVVLRNTIGSGSTAEVMQFRVNRDLNETSTVPASLRTLPDLGTPVTTRTFEFGFTGLTMTINGQGFDPNRIDAKPVIGTTEKWILKNVGPSNTPHVIHIHYTDQQIVSRNGAPPPPYELQKESWYLAPGETIEVLLRFDDYLGVFVLHCHMLEHEDLAMMTQFEVVAPPPPPPCPSGRSFSMNAVPHGDGRLRVTVTGTSPTNRLTQLQFGANAKTTGNAVIDIPSPPSLARTGAAPPFSIGLPAETTSFTFYVRRATPGVATTLPFTVVDTCGAHSTFVGGGPTAF